jgi:hypothetical protein
MASIYHNLKNAKKFKASTGLSQEQFNELLPYFEKHYKTKSKNPYPNTPTPALTNKSEALFFVLHYLKAYPTLENMALYFDIEVNTVSNYLKYTKTALKAALKELNCLVFTIFKDQKEFDEAFEGIDDLVIDCTEIPVQRPKDSDVQSFVYSGKKNSIP